jgi:hypothetical protein
MRQLNGVFTQACNRRHGRAGHLFQGRFKAILVDSHRGHVASAWGQPGDALYGAPCMRAVFA